MQGRAFLLLGLGLFCVADGLLGARLPAKRSIISPAPKKSRHLASEPPPAAVSCFRVAYMSRYAAGVAGIATLGGGLLAAQEYSTVSEFLKKEKSTHARSRRFTYFCVFISWFLHRSVTASPNAVVCESHQQRDESATDAIQPD